MRSFEQRGRSYVSELLDFANGTARRITAICGLRYHDFRLESSTDAPHGSIRWPEDTDKEGREWLCPVDPIVRMAIDRILRERPGIGTALVFPSPTDPAKPVSKDLASEWLLEAERLAELPKLKGGVWHPYWRKWATARKHESLADVAAAGGWRSKETLLRCYQQPDSATMLNVVPGGRELRQKKA
jgi:integrase